ncbi:MAG: hypothetical protein IJY42_01030 [Clostridia bacterium]|nr:hypothetical protein [Clostridia bacterium]
MKGSVRLLALLLALVMLAATACSTGGADDPNTETTTPSQENETTTPPTNSEGETTLPPPSEDPNPPADEPVSYNIIYTLATIPPVLAALASIENGDETYAFIERGKTYSGIESLDHFHNVGFDVTDNKSSGFLNSEFNLMVAKIKELDEASNGKAFFRFYIQDGTALRGAALAANAGIPADRFHVYMCEDGTGAYTALRNTYIRNKTVSDTADEPYDTYAQKVADAKTAFETVMGKTDNKNNDSLLVYNIGRAYALAALDNFTYWLQDETTVINILKETGDTPTKLLSCFGAEGYTDTVEYSLSLQYQKISQGVAALSETQRAEYLTLMYGQYYEDTYAALTRTQRAGEAAPAQKLVYIGTRHGGYPKLASNEAYGIGGLPSTATFPATYNALPDKYKCSLLFPEESDYAAFLSVLNDAQNYTEELDADVKRQVQIACFNLYIDYIYNLKLTYALYGEDYDLIMKGHPREVIGSWAEWNNRYSVSYGEDQTYVYDKLLDAALLSFHHSDSVGKYIGMVPYGTAAENLAYLGADISICGLPSSTYSGYDTDVDVLFVLAATNQTIDDVDSQVKERYEAGNLLYTDENGEQQTTVFYNLGNIYKALAVLYEANGEDELAEQFEVLFDTWLTANRAGASDIDDQGFAVTTP